MYCVQRIAHRLYRAIGIECPCKKAKEEAEKRRKKAEKRFKKAISKMLKSLV